MYILHLPEDTAQAAARKKDGARASRAADGGLLPHMRSGTGDHKLTRHATRAVGLCAVGRTPARTEHTTFFGGNIHVRPSALSGRPFRVLWPKTRHLILYHEIVGL